MNQKNSKNEPTKLYYWGIFSLAVIFRLIFYFGFGHTADDAFITFRFAEQIAAGNGFVYNLGERVLGTTTPLFTLLLAVPALLSISPLYSALAINAVSAGITVVIIHRIAVLLDFGRLAYLPPLLLIIFPRVLVTDTGGMETAFFTMLVTAALYYNARGHIPLMLAIASLAALTRPEGFILLFIVCLYRLFISAKRMLKCSFIPASLILPWIIFAWKYFGTPVPHSIPAKLALYANFGTMTIFDNVIFLLGLHHPMGIALSLFCFIGIVYLFAANRYGMCEMVWIVALVDFLAISKTHLFLWYITPMYPYFLLFAGGGIVYITRLIPFTRNNIRIVAPLLLFAAAVVLTWSAPQTGRHFARQQQTLEQVHKSIGLYLADTVGRDEIVAAEDIGYIGYYSNVKILDRDGLVSPEAVPYNREGDYFGLIKSTRPDWVIADPASPISGFVTSPEFTRLYELDKEFSSESGITYRVYKRIHQYSSASPVYE